ncbi:MAG: matrixin family metalloprotease [Cyanobacteriota bacterium]
MIKKIIKKIRKTSKKKNEKPVNQQEEQPQFTPDSRSYFDTLMYVNKNKVVRWKNMPVKVFLPVGTNITYREDYRKAAIRALNLWKVKSNGSVDYVLVNNPKKADIVVIWQDNFPELENQAGEVTTQTGQNLNQTVTGNLISSTGMFMPGYYGYAASLLGYLVGGIGNTSKIRDVKLRIGTLPAMKLASPNALIVIEAITAHEFGHAIGITCHSVNKDDIMYFEVPFNGVDVKIPTARDINTVIDLYSREPDMTN